jgi:hypothetical protein
MLDVNGPTPAYWNGTDYYSFEVLQIAGTQGLPDSYTVEIGPSEAGPWTTALRTDDGITFYRINELPVEGIRSIYFLYGELSDPYVLRLRNTVTNDAAIVWGNIP